MSNDAHPIQSYSIDRDSYVIRYGASKNIRDAEITTTIGVIVDRDISADLKKPEFHGKKYKYYILSHSKMLAKPEFIADALEDNKTEEQRSADTPESIKWEEIINRSLLYVTESDTLFEKYDRVFVEKKGSNLEIKGYPSYGRQAAFINNQFVLAADSCDIKVSTVKVLVDEEGNEIEDSEPRPSASAPNGAVSNKEQEEKKKYKYKYKITSQANCAEDLTKFQGLLDRYIESAQDAQPVEFFNGYEKVPTGAIPKKIPGKKYAKGRSHWGGAMYANSDLIIPLFMEKDLKKLCTKYYGSWGKPLHLNSVFRSHDHQMRLYELWSKKKKFMTDGSLTPDERSSKFFEEEGVAYDKINKAAKPPTSSHNYGYAVDFQLTTNPEDTKFYKKLNSSFTWKHYAEAWHHSKVKQAREKGRLIKTDVNGTQYSDSAAYQNWPKIFYWLVNNASDAGFVHPKGVATQDSFEGWHWVYKRKK